MKRLGLFLLLSPALGAQWIRATSPLSVAPEVHSVSVENGYVQVESAGLTLHSLAPWGAGGLASPGPQLFRFRFPQVPRPAPKPAVAAQGVIGTFLTGVPIYSPAAGPSWQDQNLWHLDGMARAPSRPDLFTRLGRPPQLIGYALDGYPVYAGGGYTSGYHLRPITGRRTLPDGTALTPGQEGPPVSAEYPLGAFIEDYEFAGTPETADRHNGRTVDGAYGYYATAGYPYLIGPEFRGAVQGPASCSGMELAPVTATAGQPVELALCTDSSHLERVHEKLIHLIVVSEDLREFAHLHPEQRTAAQSWSVSHTFPRPGLYRLYAEYAPAGSAARVARFTLRVAGASDSTSAPATSAWVSLKYAALRTGQDIPFQFATAEPLEPYLGAWGHFVVISADGAEFLHAHPAEELPSQDPWQHSHAQGASPAAITTTLGFARPGRYRLWAQFQRAGVVSTFSWELDVAPSPRTSMPAAVTDAIAIRVTSSGYEPARIAVTKGQPARLAFTRADAANCGSTVVFPELGIRRELPPGQTTIVELPASARDEIRFACGMGMLRGALVAAPLTSVR